MNNSSVKTVFASGVCILALFVSAFSAIRCCCDDMAESSNDASCHTVSADHEQAHMGHGQDHEVKNLVLSLAPELHSKCECVRARIAQIAPAITDPLKKADSAVDGAGKSGFIVVAAKAMFYQESPDFSRGFIHQNKLVSTPSSPRAPPVL